LRRKKTRKKIQFAENPILGFTQSKKETVQQHGYHRVRRVRGVLRSFVEMQVVECRNVENVGKMSKKIEKVEKC
jgi:hypothetical protein